MGNMLRAAGIIFFIGVFFASAYIDHLHGQVTGRMTYMILGIPALLIKGWLKQVFAQE